MPTRMARPAGTSSARGSRSMWWCTPVPAPTSAVRRRRCSSRSRASAASPGSSRRSSPPCTASTASRPWSTTSRPWPTSRGSSATAGRPSPRRARDGRPAPAPSLWAVASATPAPTSSAGAPFAALGEGRPTGTRLFALAGHVRNPGTYELEMVKTTFRDLIYAPVLGGGIRGSNTLKAFIPGGVSAPWFAPDQVDLPLGQDEVGNAGSMLGSGSVVVMDSATCMVRAAWRITKFFSRESCGQCTPCREGSGWLERIMYRIENGDGREEDLDLLMDLCDNISPGVAWPPQQTTICVLGPSIPSSIASGIRMFRDEFLVHVKEGGCPFD